MANKCLLDLIKNGKLPDRNGHEFWERTGFIAVTPSVKSPRFSDEDDEFSDDSLIRESLLDPLFKTIRLPIAEKWRDVCCKGHAGAANALEIAIKWLDDNTLDRVIVLGVDSYLDPETLQYLQINNRLKTSDQPKGLIPGEAAACFMLETEASCKKRGKTAMAYISNIATDIEINNCDSEKTNKGVALTAALRKILNPMIDPFKGHIMVDINGEDWRSNAFGFSQVRLGNMLEDDVTYSYSAESLGDIGAATGPVSVCIITKSFLRGYAKSSDALILLNSEEGEVGVVHLCAS